MVAVNPPSLRRRNTVPATVSIELRLPSKPQRSSFPMAACEAKELANLDLSPYTTLGDFSYTTLKPLSYTSLRDLLPSSPNAIQSPTACEPVGSGGREISIKNRLVKQAAWAYLQPMAASPSEAGNSFFRRVWSRFTGDFVWEDAGIQIFRRLCSRFPGAIFRVPVRSCVSFLSRQFDRISRVFDRLILGIRGR
ncbi:hypothetical protein AMTRI_Chr11g95590 [Amborella trichopoda]|uniref:Uncharacterized protein n=1 Tax=Amborella trichopoda TaxID=13333 RepID=U5CSF5_AMBTC|nr:uncharacterized protein LOC18444474 [Amborella trichopoda]ERN16176.1 hypothetical protein AMTR_s00030p00233530 [Amborella trichopoda]|eukprot:XP_006854709.1 uncharacterized protein LOC18444474 [Amborella trichopoda]